MIIFNEYKYINEVDNENYNVHCTLYNVHCTLYNDNINDHGKLMTMRITIIIQI